MTTPDPLYVTTPIYYVNAKPHIGHAYTTVLADVMRRYAAASGAETYFATGTDEHGQKVQEAADARGVTPQQHVDELHVAFKETWPTIGCAPDQFIRTTEPRHKAVVQRALTQLHDAGLIEERVFEGWYSKSAERFWTEKDLIDGRCPETGTEVVRLAERNYFFLMSRFEADLRAAIVEGQKPAAERNPDAPCIEIVPSHRANEVLGFLDKGLQDLCISRPKERMSWGVEIPFDTDFVTYVWVDALLNYVTAIGGLGAADDNRALGLAADFEAWWPHVTHVIGKDILTTHLVYWPTLLLGLGLPLPRRVVVHGWWLVDDAKMSKSVGNVVNPLSLKDKYGPEVLRYFLMREMSVGQDAGFSEAALVGCNNTHLANDLGNLVQRVGALISRHFDGQVPRPGGEPSEPAQAAIDTMHALIDTADMVLGADDEASAVAAAGTRIAQSDFRGLLQDVEKLLGQLNVVVTSDAPFKTVRTDKDAAATTVYHVLAGLRVAAHLLEPVMPEACREVLRRVGHVHPEGGHEPIALTELRWDDLQPGAPVAAGDPLFPRFKLELDDKQGGQATKSANDKQQKKPKQNKSKQNKQSKKAPAGPVDSLDFGDFLKLDLRVGLVKVAEEVAKSDKLVRLEVDLGELGTRQVVSGVRPSLTPADLLGQRVPILVNLAPRKIMGLQSQGMMLLAETPTGALVPLHPAGGVDSAAAPGAKIG